MTLKINKLLQFLAFSFLLCLALLLLTDKWYIFAVKKGLGVWVATVMPTVFPYLFVTAILCKMNITSKICFKGARLTKRLFRVGGASAGALFTSLLCGYPLGAKCVADLKKGGLLSPTESQRACVFCSSVSPVYVLTGVGLLAFNNRLFGVLILVINLLSCLIMGLTFTFYNRKAKLTDLALLPSNCDNVFYESLFTAISSTLFLGGVIVLSTIVCESLLAFTPFNLLINGVGNLFDSNLLAQGLLTGLVEYTYGIRIIASQGITFWTLPLCSLLCGFGGICVNIQCLFFLKGAKIKIMPYLFSKVGQGLICFLLGLVFNLFIL